MAEVQGLDHQYLHLCLRHYLPSCRSLRHYLPCFRRRLSCRWLRPCFRRECLPRRLLACLLCRQSLKFLLPVDRPRPGEERQTRRFLRHLQYRGPRAYRIACTTRLSHTPLPRCTWDDHRHPHRDWCCRSSTAMLGNQLHKSHCTVRTPFPHPPRICYESHRIVSHRLHSSHNQCRHSRKCANAHS